MFSATLKPLSMYARQRASDRTDIPAHLSTFFAVLIETRLAETQFIGRWDSAA